MCRNFFFNKKSDYIIQCDISFMFLQNLNFFVTRLSKNFCAVAINGKIHFKMSITYVIPE